MSKLARACLRCIERKRKCDHVHPECGTCTRASVVCEYPSPQHRRGPLGGFSRTAEDRALAAEDALGWLLARPEVQELLESLDGTVAIPPYQDRSLSKESRVAYWTKHQLNTVSDLRAYPKHTFPPLRHNEAAEQRIKSREETMSSGDASQSGDESDADVSAMNPHVVVPQSTTLQLPVPSTTTHQDTFAGPSVALARMYDPPPQPYDQPPPEDSSISSMLLCPDSDNHRHPHQASHQQHYPPLQPMLHQHSFTPKLDALAAWAGRLPTLDPPPMDSVEVVDRRDEGSAPVQGIINDMLVPGLRTGQEDAQTVSTTAMTDLFW